MSEKQEVKDQEQLQEEKSSQNAAEEHTSDKKDESQEAENKELSIEDELARIRQELDEAKDQRLRLYAEFENFRRRTAKERVELFSTANQELMTALLPILDDFNRALKAQEDDKATEGVKLIHNKLENTLKSKGLKPMESTIGKDFDADTMEAVTQIPAPDKKQKGKVIDEIEPGYQLGNKILRYAKVVVGQ